MSDINTRVSELLADKYVMSKSPQEILDNPIFNQLPLETRVSILEKNKEGFSSAKPPSAASVMGMLSLGGLMGAASLGSAAKGLHLPPQAYLTAAGVGGVIGTVLPAVVMRKNFKRDESSAEDIANNRFLEAIAQRSMSVKKPVPGVVDPKSIMGTVYNSLISRTLEAYKK